MTRAKRQVVTETFADFKHLFSRLLAYDIFFKIIAVATFGPLTTWIAGTLISTTGSPVIGNTAIIGFILSPAGVIMLILLGTLSSTSQFAEKTGLIVIGSGRMSGQKATFLNTIWVAVKKLPNLLGLAFLQTLLTLLVAVPFALLLGIGYKLFLTQNNINYYLTSKPPEFQMAVALGAVILVGLGAALAYLYLRWLFTVPIVIFEDRRFYSAIGRSHSLMKGNYRRAGILVFSWAAVMVAAAAVAVIGLTTLADMLLAHLGQNLNVIIVSSALIADIIILMTSVISFVGITINSLLIARLYFERCTEEGRVLSVLPESELRETVDVSGTRVASRKLLWLAAIVFFIFAGILSIGMIESLDIDTHFQITAHRGYSAVAPENTLSAIMKAIEAEADMAEIDVQETADGTIVLLHDDDLMRVTGVNKGIWEVTYDEIKDLDAGSWFSPEFKGERIPTLEEAIDVAQGKIKLMVELKYNGHDQKLADRTLAILQDKDFVPQSVIHTLSYEGGLEAKSLNPDIQIGYIAGVALGDVSQIDYDFLSLEQSMASPDVISSAQEHDKTVAVWTVDDHDDMITMITRGVDNIITDEPELLRDVRAEVAELSDIEIILLAFQDIITN